MKVLKGNKFNKKHVNYVFYIQPLAKLQFWVKGVGKASYKQT